MLRTTLRGRIERVQDAIADARRGGHGYEAALHRARLADLLDLAARSDVDVSAWLVDPGRRNT